jgi:hypothetical protein
MKWYAIVFGVVAGIIFIGGQWSPFVERSYRRDGDFSDIVDTKKREFMKTLFETFESGNPCTEIQDLDTNSHPDEYAIMRHSAQFDKILHQIRSRSYSTKKVTTPTRWANMDATDRTFNVFILNDK